MTMPKCRLFLVVPSGLAAATARACLAEALAAGDVAALKVTGASSEQERLLDAVQATAGNAGVAVLNEDDVDLAVERKTDGVEVAADAARLAAARHRLGNAAIVGARCGASRHAAMELAEAGADYVVLDAGTGASESLISWWAELIEVPCVAAPLPGTAARAVADGADFVVVPAAMWASPQAARREVAALTAIVAGTKA